MPKQATTDGFQEGVSGSGQKWQDRVGEAAEEGRYGPGEDGQENYENNAGTSESDAKYRRNVAASFGLDEDDISAAPSDGIDSDSARKWAQGVSESAERWAEGVSEVSASEWEEKTSESANEWLQNTKEGLAPGE